MRRQTLELDEKKFKVASRARRDFLAIFKGLCLGLDLCSLFVLIGQFRDRRRMKGSPRIMPKLSLDMKPLDVPYYRGSMPFPKTLAAPTVAILVPGLSEAHMAPRKQVVDPDARMEVLGTSVQLRSPGKIAFRTPSTPRCLRPACMDFLAAQSGLSRRAGHLECTGEVFWWRSLQAHSQGKFAGS